MLIACQIRIVFAPAQIPGQLNATVQWLTNAGELLGQVSPQPVAVGQALYLGSVHMEVKTSEWMEKAQATAADLPQTVTASQPGLARR